VAAADVSVFNCSCSRHQSDKKGYFDTLSCWVIATFTNLFRVI